MLVSVNGAVTSGSTIDASRVAPIVNGAVAVGMGVTANHREVSVVGSGVVSAC